MRLLKIEQIEKIKAWSKERGVNTLTPLSQLLGAINEILEARLEIIRGIENLHNITLELGNVFVQMINYELACGVSPVNISDDLPRIEPPTNTDKLIFEIVKCAVALESGTIEETQHQTRILYSFLRHLCESYGTSPQQALDAAYNKIKDRKGRIIGDKWVKE